MVKMFFNVLATFVEFEGDLIRLRTREEMAIAGARKTAGKQSTLLDKQQKELCRMHGSGECSISDLAELFSVSRPTVYRTLSREIMENRFNKNQQGAIMYNNNEVISYLQANKILALKLDHAVSAVGEKVRNQVDALREGATRLLYYTSCFTDEYNDVCQQQKTEDLRFRNAVIRIISMVTLSLKCFGSTLRKYSNTKLMLN